MYFSRDLCCCFSTNMRSRSWWILWSTRDRAFAIFSLRSYSSANSSFETCCATTIVFCSSDIASQEGPVIALGAGSAVGAAAVAGDNGAGFC